MKKLIAIAILFTACASTKPTPPSPVVTPPVVVTPPPEDTVYLPSKTDTVYLPGKIVVRDSAVLMHDTLPVVINRDSVGGLIPDPSGDNWAQLQAILSANLPLRLGRYNYPYSKPLVVANLVNGGYRQSWCSIRGVASAKNAPIAFTSNLIPAFSNAPAIILQQCKGCEIKDINIIGRYTFPGSLSEVQIDTLTFAQWDDGTCRTNNTSPYAGIAIDPFSDPADFGGVDSMYPGLSQYYLPGMNQSGSTAVKITGCSITSFIAGIILAPGFQENGEEIDITDCSIHNCRSAICPTNAQQKSNRIQGLQVWGGVHTIIDCSRYGAHRGDGSICPVIDGVNIAGFNHQFINYFSGSHPGSARNVYAEGLYKIGFAGGPAGFNFDNCQFNLQLPDVGVPFPDFVVAGGIMTLTNTEIRTYGDSMRIILNTIGSIFHWGTITNPPVCINQEMPPAYPRATFDNVSMYLSGALLNGNGYDSLVVIGTAILTVNPDFTGYLHLYSPAGITSNKAGDLLITQHPYGDDYPQYGGPIGSMEYPVGVVTGIGGTFGDTIYLRHIGQGLHTGDILTVQNTKIKTQ